MERLEVDGLYPDEGGGEVDMAIGRLDSCFVLEHDKVAEQITGEANSEYIRKALFNRSRLDAIRLGVDYSDVMLRSAAKAMDTMEDYGYWQHPGDTLDLPPYMQEKVGDLPIELRILFGVDES